MFKHRKIIAFAAIFVMLILSVSAISAADDNSTPGIDNTDVQVADESVTNDELVSYAQDNNIEKSNPKTIKSDDDNTIAINKDNYRQLGWSKDEDDNGNLAISYNGSKHSNNVTFIFEDTIADNLNSISIEEGDNITISAESYVEFNNVAFAVYKTTNITFKDLVINIDENYVPTYIFNPNIIHINSESSGTRLDNVYVNYYLPETVEVPYPASVLDIQSDANVVDSTFIINTYTSTVDWDPMSNDYGTNKIMPIRSQNKNDHSNVTFTNNMIYINATRQVGGYPTLYAIMFESPNSIISDNSIEIHGIGWLYAICTKGNYTKILNNQIYVTGVNYTGGIFIQDASYCLVDNNTITLESAVSKVGMFNEPCTYGIVIENYAYTGATYREGTGKVKNNTISNNNIFCTANNMYGIEQFGGDNTTVTGNFMEIHGETAMGVGIIGANTIISDNEIIVNGSVESNTTVDYLGAKSTGILTARGSNAHITGNTINSTFSGILTEGERKDTIEDNIITSEGDYSVKLVSSNYTTVTNNYLVAKNEVGDSSVYTNTQTNTIENNGPEATLIETEIIITSDVASDIELYELIDIEGYFTANGVKTNFDSIKIYDNDEIIEVITPWDYEGGIYYTYDVESLGAHNLTFVFEGNDTHLESETSLTFNVYDPDAKIDSYIDLIIDSSVFSGEEFPIDAILHADDDDETPISDATVIIKIIINDETIFEDETTTDDEGWISYPLDTTGMEGTATVELTFEGDSTYSESTASDEIEILPPKKDVIMMLACDDEYYIGEYILVDGTVFTIADDEAVSGLDIDIDITYSDDTFNSITVTTDDEGSFTAQLPANVLGEATITAIIPENDFYNPLELVTETVTIIQRPAADTLLVIDVESPIISGDTLEVNGQLVYYDDNQDEYPISNADVNVKVTMGNEVISQTTVTTDDEGMLQYTMNTSNLAGIMVVEMTFEGNDYYLSSEATEEVEILPAKQNVLITVEADDEIDITIITSGTLFVDDDNQTPVADQTVEITIAYSDGTSITVYNTTDENGMFTTIFEASIPGETTITANFAGNDDYNEASAETVIIIFSFEPVETFITVDVESPINSGDEMVIDGIIIPDDEDDEDELYLGELPITIRITLDDEVILETTVETDDDGMISYAFDTTGIAGSATVELTFDGNDDYLASSDSAVVEILPVKQDVFIALDADDSYELDSTIVVSGELSLTDDDQTPVAGQTVVITVTYSDDTSTTVNSITDDDGSFMAEIPASVVGEVTITASVVDSQLYNDATEEITTEITAPEPVETSIDYVAADSIYSGDNLTVDAILHVADDDETPVAGVEVTIRVTVDNDVSEASVISNDDGSVSFTFDTTGLEGTALVEIEFEGNDEYAACSASDEVLIKPARKEVIILIEADDNYPDNEDMILSGIAYAVDDDETPVEGATVNIVVKFSDESTATYSTVTDTDGTFNVTVSMENLVVGIVDITATIDESDEYYKSTTDATTEIVHKTFETFLTVNADSQISSGEELVIDGMIFYNDGDDECALADAPINVKVTVDGEVILETTVNSDSEGMISYTFDTTGITGSATVELTFDGNDDYLASSDTTVVEIIKVKKNVTIEAFIDDEYSLGQEIVVKGSLTATDDQSPISKEISLSIAYGDDSTKTITTTTGEDGSFTASFNATVLGPVTITVSSDEDDDYLEAQCVLATDINKIATSLNVNILNSTLGNVTIEAIVTDEEDNPLTEGTILVKDANGNQILSVEMTSETTIISIPADTAGQLKIKVEFLENEMYLPSVTINQSALETPDEYLTIIDVVRNIRESIVTLDDITAFINNTATITATVKDTDGNDIESGVVEFVDGEGNVLGQANVENGIASIEVLYAKEFTTQITANYISDSEYITDSSATATLTSRKAMTIIEFNELSLVAGQTVNITARVYDEAGNNITVGKVVFKINGKTLKDANGKVIYAKVVNGTATIEYLVPEELAGERVELSATYSGNSKTPGANTSTTIYVNTKEASLTLDSPQEAQIGSTVTFTATINDNNIVNNGKVVFKINGKSLKDANGKVIYAKIINNVASIEYVIPESMKAKEYTLTAVLLCDEYDRLEATKNITITN